MKTRLDHVRINVKDLQKSIAWYREVLGFELCSLWPPECPIYADFYYGEGAQFAIMEASPVPTGGRFNFYTDNIDGMWEQLKNRVAVVEELFDTPYGSRKFTIRDLDGNELGFIRG